MKRQSQINESRHKICEAFLTLLEDSEFAVITLSEIAAHAGVTRMTLHRHFKSKENIILYMAQKSLESQWNEVKDSDTPLIQLMYKRLEALKNLPVRELLMESNELGTLLANFRLGFHKGRLQTLVQPELANDPYFYSFYFGGMTAMVRAWLEDDCTTPTMELVQKIAQYTSRFMSPRALPRTSPIETAHG